ncbi:uncharacterized protein LOC126709598 [Quercus robur]|uniref:uncharacterized protein LOC126709598 n=1 Tax=Quercus robur TaxID=38942 RepID=UPI002163AAA7|nr:uncharacterized protein LOC126709598 [Quercus robur]
MLEERIEKGDQHKDQKAARTSKASFMHKSMESSGNSSTLRCKDGLKLNVEKSGVKENQTKKVNSSSLFSAKKPASNIEAVTATKRTLETNVKLSGASRTFRRGPLRGDSSFKNSEGNLKCREVKNFQVLVMGCKHTYQLMLHLKFLK